MSTVARTTTPAVRDVARGGRGSIKNEPADFKVKVETRLKAAIAEYQKISNMS